MAKRCTFCGASGGLSKEHIWPKWMASYFPAAGAPSHRSEVYSGQAKGPQTLERRTERPGLVTTKKIQAVCHGCNNTWMSQLEGRTKPVLLRALQDELQALTPEESATLGTWAVLKTMVGECATEKTLLTPFEDRASMYRTQAIPDFFRVYAALHASETKAGYMRHSTTISSSRARIDPPLSEDLDRNIQTTSFLVGGLCLYVTAIRATGVSVDLLTPPVPMHRLGAGAVELGQTTPLSNEQLRLMANWLDLSVMRNDKVVYGGDIARGATDGR